MWQNIKKTKIATKLKKNKILKKIKLGPNLSWNKNLNKTLKKNSNYDKTKKSNFDQILKLQIWQNSKFKFLQNSLSDKTFRNILVRNSPFGYFLTYISPFLAVQSSSKSLVVGPFVGPSVCRSVGPSFGPLVFVKKWQLEYQKIIKT